MHDSSSGQTQSAPQFAAQSFQRLSDFELLREVKHLCARERALTVDMLVALGEVDKRGLYLSAGFPSLYMYCTTHLHLSEHEAYLRIEACRAAHSYPPVLEMLADGRLTLTAVAILRGVLTADNHAGVLEAATHKTKRQVRELVAQLRPQPAVESSSCRIPVVSASGTGSVPSEGEEAVTSVALAEAREAFERSEVTPLAPDRYKLEVTISREAHEMLCRLQELMRHVVPNGDPARIVERALQVMLADMERRKIARTERPHRFAPCRTGSRYVPFHVRRAVWERDAGQCAYIGTTGRCPERGFLEFHHVLPYSEGGMTTIENLELRCRAHNAFEALLSDDGLAPPSAILDSLWPTEATTASSGSGPPTSE